MFNLTEKYFQVRVAGGLQDDVREEYGCSLQNGLGSSLKYQLSLTRRIYICMLYAYIYIYIYIYMHIVYCIFCSGNENQFEACLSVFWFSVNIFIYVV